MTQQQLITEPDEIIDGRSVTIDVRGLPRPQGSMRLHKLPNGSTAARYPAAVYEWRAQVQQAVAEVLRSEEQRDLTQFVGAVEMRLGFELPRPASHFGTGRNRGQVRGSAPTWPRTMPDLDKLVRCVSDAITDAGLWHDDGQVCVIHSAKRYTTEVPGVLITVTELP